MKKLFISLAYQYSCLSKFGQFERDVDIYDFVNTSLYYNDGYFRKKLNVDIGQHEIYCHSHRFI